MGTQENKMIRQKINNLAGLPDGYHVNLESKWTLLEAALEKKKKPFPWKTLAAAVLVLFVSVSLLWLLGNKENKKQEARLAAPVPGHKTAYFPLATLHFENKVPVKAIYTLQRKQDLVSTATRDTLADVPQESVVYENPVKQQETLVLEPAKKTRFVELDFNEGLPPGTTYAEPPVAGQQFKVRLGTHSAFSGQKAKTNNSSRLKLKQTF